MATNTKLQREMQLRGWGHRELADQVGADTKTVARWIKGASPQPHFRTQLCNLFLKNAEELGLIEEVSSVAPNENREATNKKEYGDASGHHFLQRHTSGRIFALALLSLIACVILGNTLMTYAQSSRTHNSSQQTQLSPLYSDPLTPSMNVQGRLKAQWEATSYCNFLTDGFHIMDLYSKGHHACMANNLSLRDLDVSVDVKINHGAFITIYLRGNVTTNRLITGYYVRINIDGKYSVQYNASDTPGHDKQLIPWTIPDAKSLYSGNSVWNTLRIKLQGSKISLWFNKRNQPEPDFVGTVPLLASKGIIGFGANTSNQKPPLDVTFRNLAVYDLSKQ